MKPLLSAILAIALLAWPSARAAAPDPANSPAPGTPAPSPDDPVVAQGNGFVIRRSAMDQVLATAKAEDPKGQLPPDADVHVINQLIEIQLVLQKATDAEKADGQKNAAERIAAIAKSLGATEFDHRLQVTRMTAADLQLMLSQEMTAQASLTRQLGIQATDADAKKFFDDHPGAFDQPATAHVRELLLLTTSDFSTSAAPPLPAATIQAKHQQILDLYKRVQAGEDFAALAKQYNEDPISKETGGELYFLKDQMGFGDLAFSMKPNQVSDVLTDEDGYRIFKLIEIIPPRKGDFAALDDRLKAMLIGKQKRTLAPAYLNQLQQAANVQILDADLKAKVAAAEAQAAENAKAQAAYLARQAAAAANTPPASPPKS